MDKTMTSQQFDRFADLASRDDLTQKEAAELERLYAISEAQTGVRAAWERQCDEAFDRAAAVAAY